MGRRGVARPRFAAPGLEAHPPPALEWKTEIVDDRPAVAERLGRANRAFDPIAIRDREHFFGRQIGDEADTGLRDGRAAHPDVSCWKSNGEIGPWSRESQRRVSLAVHVFAARGERG